jgi:hypothetical protein
LSRGLFEVAEEAVEEGGSVGLVVVSGVVALAAQGGLELDGGAEVAAGLAGAFHAAVELDGSGAQAIAEHAGVGFAAELGHGGGLVAGGELEGLAVEVASTCSLMAWYSSATTRSVIRA